MRSVIVILVGLIVAVIAAVIVTVILNHIPGAPGWLDPIVWAVAILLWLLWAFGGLIDRRVP